MTRVKTDPASNLFWFRSGPLLLLPQHESFIDNLKAHSPHQTIEKSKDSEIYQNFEHFIVSALFDVHLVITNANPMFVYCFKEKVV